MSLANANEFIKYLRENVPGNVNSDFGWTRDQIYAEAKLGGYGLTIREIYDNILKGCKNRVLSNKTGKSTGKYYPALLDEEIILAAQIAASTKGAPAKKVASKAPAKVAPAEAPIIEEDELLLAEDITLELDEELDLELTDEELEEQAEWESEDAFLAPEIGEEFDCDFE